MQACYRLLIAAHASAAVLGLGLITAVAIAARVIGKSQHTGEEAPLWLMPLLRYSAISLAGMLVTGVLLDLAASGAWHGSWWFRASVLLLIATGALHGRIRSIVRHDMPHDGGSRGALLRISRMAFSMCGLILVITVLMETKPF
jgi:hypothetical protein